MVLSSRLCHDLFASSSASNTDAKVAQSKINWRAHSLAEAPTPGSSAAVILSSRTICAMEYNSWLQVCLVLYEEVSTVGYAQETEQTRSNPKEHMDVYILHTS